MTSQDLANEIILEAQSRINKGMKYQNLNSAIHAVLLEVQNELMDVMKYTKE